MNKLRATLLVTAEEPESRLAAHQWLGVHQNALDFVSENLGCGCCVDIWNVEGDRALIEQIPPELLGSSAWASGCDDSILPPAG